jgi:hypothetical protein
MSIVSGDFNTPTTRSSSIDSEEFITPFSIMENNDVNDDNIPDVPETVNDPTAPMTLEDLAQLMANGFANVNARINSLNRSTEIDKDITDRRIDNLILANRQLNDDIKVIQVRQLMTDGYVHLTDNNVEVIKNINYQSNQDEALIEHDDITITGKVMFINEYTEGLLIALTIADKDAVVANITTKNLLTNVHATDIKLNDIIKLMQDKKCDQFLIQEIKQGGLGDDLIKEEAENGFIDIQNFILWEYIEQAGLNIINTLCE